MRPRQTRFTASGLALLPAVHVFSDEPFKATDEHTHWFLFRRSAQGTCLRARFMSYPRPITSRQRIQRNIFE